jgi:hypothetical protein
LLVERRLNFPLNFLIWGLESSPLGVESRYDAARVTRRSSRLVVESRYDAAGVTCRSSSASHAPPLVLPAARRRLRSEPLVLPAARRGFPCAAARVTRRSSSTL